MTSLLFEIHYAQVIWGGCADERPWLLVKDLGGGAFGCFPISGQCYGESCFFLDFGHADFSSTGLTKSCYIHDSSIIRVEASQFRRFKGALSKQLLKEFRDFSGM